MNWIDVLIIATMVLCFILGLLSGLVWQVAGIVALVVGVVATIFFGPPVSAALLRWIENAAIARLLAYIGVFSLASMAVRVLATVFSNMLERLHLEKLDKLLGGVVGAVKALLICAILIVIAERLGTPGWRRAAHESLLGGVVVSVVDFVAGKADTYDVKQKARDAWEKGRAAAEDLHERGASLLQGEDGHTQEAGDAMQPDAGTE